jgi:predicted ABC-type transport system involved in lysophospholipase L1 biosynthesis ATPase subunit
VRKGFPAGDGRTLEVLRGVDADIAPCERVAIVGPSGSGKSTLLAIVGGLDMADAGEVWMDDAPLHTWDEPTRARLRGRDVGFVFQAHHLLPQLTAIENVLVPAWTCGAAASLADEAARLLADLGLADRLTHRPAQLSGGECQRVAVARALLLRPRLLLADEPTGALDREGARSLAGLLVQLCDQAGVTLVAVTHAEELAACMTRRFRLADGVLREAARS